MRAEIPSDPESRTLTLGGESVIYTDEGSGPVLVAIHGCPGSTRDWRWMGHTLEANFRLIRVDLPGFGQTPVKAGPAADMAGRAAWVIHFLDSLNIDMFSVLAHSAGGFVALELAARYPERIQALSLVAAPGLRPHRAFRAHPLTKYLAYALKVPVVKPILTRQLHTWFSKAGFPSGLRDETVQQTMQIIAAADFKRQSENVSLLRIPTLVAWSQDDGFIEGAIGDELSQKCPHGPRLNFPDGGHYLQKTQSEEITIAMVNWLCN